MPRLHSEPIGKHSSNAVTLPPDSVTSVSVRFPHTLGRVDCQQSPGARRLPTAIFTTCNARHSGISGRKRIPKTVFLRITHLAMHPRA